MTGPSILVNLSAVEFHSYVYEYPGICSVFVRVITFMMITLDKSVGNAAGSRQQLVHLSIRTPLRAQDTGNNSHILAFGPRFEPKTQAANRTS